MNEVQPHANDMERRRVDRTAVSLPTQWDHRRLEGQPGELLDVSHRGLFLRPEGGTVRFRPNDEVVGHLMIRGEARTVRAVVRWRGWSLEHRCVGLGLRLHEDSALSDDDIHAIQWPQDAAGRPVLRLLTHD